MSLPGYIRSLQLIIPLSDFQIKLLQPMRAVHIFFILFFFKFCVGKVIRNNIRKCCYCKTNLVEVYSLIEPLLTECCQIHQTIPLLIDLINTLLNLVSPEISCRDEIVANLENRFQMGMSGCHFIFHCLKTVMIIYKYIYIEIVIISLICNIQNNISFKNIKLTSDNHNTTKSYTMEIIC